MKISTIHFVTSFIITLFTGISSPERVSLSEGSEAPSVKEILEKLSDKVKGIKIISYDSYYKGYNSSQEDSLSWYKATCWLQELPGDTIWGFKMHLKGSDYQNRITDYYYDGIKAYELDHNKKMITIFNAHEYGRSDMNNPAKARNTVIPLLQLIGAKNLKTLLNVDKKETSIIENKKEWILILKNVNKILSSTDSIWVEKKNLVIKRYVQDILWNGTRMIYDHTISNIKYNEPEIETNIALTETFPDYTITNYKDQFIKEKESVSLLGKKAVDFSYPAQSGETISLASLKGKIVLLDFWESWCGYCILSFPKLTKLYQKYKAKNVEVIGISSENKKQIEKLLTLNDVQYPNLFADKEIIKNYGITNRPTYILIDEQGTIIACSYGELDVIEKKLEEIIK